MTSTQSSSSLDMKRGGARVRELAKGIHGFLTVFIALLFFSQYVFAQDPLSRSVVKIFTSCLKPNSYLPWQIGAQYNGGGSGSIIAGRRILTNAHVVSNQVYIQVQKAGDSRRYTANVEHVAHDCDLALLKISDEAETDLFFEGTQPIELGGIPKRLDEVVAYGFPVGGNELSTTKGVVSRVEVRLYEHSNKLLLAIQISAVLNPGNSGGPVIMDGRLVGVAFEKMVGIKVEGIGYIIPVPIIEHFLKDLEDGMYGGFPWIGILAENMESQSMRNFYGMGSDDTGVLVTKVFYGSSAWGVLEEDDVLLAIDTVNVNNDGTVRFRENEKLDYADLITRRQVGENLDIRVLRHGKEMSLSMRLVGWSKPLVPGPQYDVLPTYYIFAGLVFQPLSYDYINDYVMLLGDPPVEFTNLYLYGEASDGHMEITKEVESKAIPSVSKKIKEIVILGSVLVHDINIAYHEMGNVIVRRINGKEISNMKDVIEAFRTPSGGYHFIEFNQGVDKPRIIIDADRASAATYEIMEKYDIQNNCSADLRGDASCISR